MTSLHPNTFANIPFNRTTARLLDAPVRRQLSNEPGPVNIAHHDVLDLKGVGPKRRAQCEALNATTLVALAVLDDALIPIGLATTVAALRAARVR